jgi:hypothetical protein
MRQKLTMNTPFWHNDFENKTTTKVAKQAFGEHKMRKHFARRARTARIGEANQASECNI